MQYIIKTIARLPLLLLPLCSLSQSTYLPQGDKNQHFLERLEILLQKNSDLNLSTAKPMSRRFAVRAAYSADSIQKTTGNLLTKVDQYNLQSVLMNNSEWVTGDKSGFASKHPVWNAFYKTKANFIEVNDKDFFLAINPVLDQQQSVESNNNERVFVNSKGVTFRGMIAGKLGFSAFVTDNQERGPLFEQGWVIGHTAVPGVGFYKHFKNTATDYFDARGSINFTAAKYLDFQFGYDKNFIGNGYRSLFLSDFGASYLFLKINTRIWKLNYENIFMELTPEFVKSGSDVLLPKKYAALHHLSLNATKWLNVGFFESVVFGRVNHFDFTYLNPIIFLRAAETENGSPDNAFVGFDFKANVAKRLQFYSQVLIDEFVLNQLKGGKGWWGNKFGLQFGGKYINAFSVKNLDLQGEINLARPFTYSHNDSVANYTHYNQPLAHPLGANFVEAIGIVRYQPVPKWTISGRMILWSQGVDTGNSNIGTDIFKINTTRAGDFGYKLPAGPKGTTLNAQFLVSFEVKENLFLEGSVMIRNSSSIAGISPSMNTSLITAGVRMNVFRREYDY